MSEKIVVGTINLFKLPNVPQEKIFSDLVAAIYDVMEDYNRDSKKGWVSGFIQIGNEELPFGDAAVCDSCTVHYLLEDTDFQEVGNKLLCSVCQSRREN